MYKSLFAYMILLLFLMLPKLKAQSKYNLQSFIQCGTGTEPLFAKDILEKRIPQIDLNQSTPNQCYTEITKKKDIYRKNDLNDIDKIINEYCSHMDGWAEYNPGTCQAGGPPPICPANHWYKDGGKAKIQWDKKLADILKERSGEIKSVICDCWSNTIKESFDQQNQNILQHISPRAITNNSATDIKLPCRQAFGQESCEKGYKCVDGFCVPVATDLEKLLQNPQAGDAVDRLKDWARDEILGTIAKEFGVIAEKIVKVYNHNVVGLVIEALNPNELLTDADGYTIAANNLSSHFSSYYTLLLELNRYYNNGIGVRDKNLIIFDLNKVKAEMTNSFYLLGQHYSYMKSSKEILHCSNCCDKAFEEYHRQLVVYFSILNSVTFN